MSEETEKSSVGVQAYIAPTVRDAQTQIAPEYRHIAIGNQIAMKIILYYCIAICISMHVAATQPRPTVSHIGIQC